MEQNLATKETGRLEMVSGWNWYVDNETTYGPMACVYYKQPSIEAGQGCAEASIKNATTHR